MDLLPNQIEMTHPRHPLDPLSAQEIQSAVSMIQIVMQSHSMRFVSVSVNEPEKAFVDEYSPGQIWDRQAYAITYDPETSETHEWTLSLTSQKILGHEVLSGVQPNILLDEFIECEEAVKIDPRFQAAMEKRGITNMDRVMIDPWSAGNYGNEDHGRQRLVRALTWVRQDSDDNGYAHPVEGLLTVVDLNTMRVVDVEDNGVIPIPEEPGNYAADRIPGLRTDLKPLHVTQPEGPSFTVDGYQVKWQKWAVRIGFTAREGLVLHSITYEDNGRLRPIIYRASLAEMVVPYGDPGANHNRQNAFDAGEYGIGMLANSLELGCDCLGTIRYFDAHLVTSHGDPFTIKHAICLHEEDFGTLWKHTDWRNQNTEVRRSRRLVISSIATVANYEYGFFWYFYLDGTIQFEVKLTGIVNTGAVRAGDKPKYATLLNEELMAPIHQHFFSVRMDMEVDGRNNSIVEVHTEKESLGSHNPLGNGFYAKSTILRTEQEAQQIIDPFSARYWKIINPHVLNEKTGEPVAFKLIPGENVLPFADSESSLIQRAGFITKHLWVTPYNPNELYAAGPYPNQHPGGAGLPEWTAANRSITDSDIVVWYTMGHHHVVRPEDWPVMPVAYIGFSLKPSGFFPFNPSLDVPPQSPLHGSCEV